MFFEEKCNSWVGGGGHKRGVSTNIYGNMQFRGWMIWVCDIQFFISLTKIQKGKKNVKISVLKKCAFFIRKMNFRKMQLL